MDKQALYNMFKTACYNDLRYVFGWNRWHKRFDLFMSFATAAHYPDMSIYIPKGSKAIKPCMAVMVQAGGSVEEFAKIAESTLHSPGNATIYLIGAGHVELAGAGERVVNWSE